MSVIQRLRHLLHRSKPERQLSLPHLFYWIVILVIALITIFFMTSSPTYASSSHTHTQQNTKPDGGGGGGGGNTLNVEFYTGSCSTPTEVHNNNQNQTNLKAPLGIDSLLYFTDPCSTLYAFGIPGIWSAMLGVVDIFMVLLITLNAMRIMVSGSIFRYADVAETVPRILLALIMAHLSFIMIGFFLALNNTLCLYLVHWGDALMNTSHTDALMDMHSPGGSLWDIVSDLQALLTWFIEILFLLAKFSLALIIYGQMIIRLIMIALYVIFSAPCIACSALPGRSGQPITQMWLKGFITLIFSQMVQVGGLIAAEIVLNVVDAELSQKGGPLQFVATVVGQDNLANIVNSFAGVVVLWFILKVPSLLGSPATQMMAGGGSMMAGMVGGAVGAIAGVAAGAGSGIAGAGGWAISRARGQ
ncbi:MAG TPA: hypothetical protein VKR06_40595 [Ktedonosporobacter sp.]|nr:hypothetical protein [Ktedonosporobacter sp.]